MGKRILTEAGYEVVAVSNGAAAVKKIAEQKPDIIILDLYMPGYSGLEVCEKVRGSVATLKTPVLLTVGKMEPYRPEDASRVRADGVIVKPFEASDLLAIVKKFEERIVPPPLVEPTVAIRNEEEPEPELVVEHNEPVRNVTAQSMVDVPDHMASSSAFTDLLATDSPDSAAGSESAFPPVDGESPAPELPKRTAVPEYELPVSWRDEDASEKTEVELPPAATLVPEPQFQVAAAAEAQPAATPPPPRPLQIPVYQEPEDSAADEMLPTAAPAIGEIEIPREPFLQESAAETTRNTVVDSVDPMLVSTRNIVADSVEPGLVSAFQPEASAFPSASSATTEASSMVAADSQFATAHAAAPVSPTASAEPVKAPEPLSDADFEARVAAAMAAYNHPEIPSAGQEAAPSVNEDHGTHSAVQETPAFTPNSDEAAPISEPAAPGSQMPEQVVPIFEYRPPVNRIEHQVPEVVEPEPEPASQAAAASHQQPEWQSSSDSTLAPVLMAETRSSSHEQEAVAAVDAASKALTSAVADGSGADRDTIAQAVHRVVERLKPELVDEIMREIKSRQ